MTRALLNNSIFIISLLLQWLLLVLVFERRVGRRLPVFTTLLVFYPLRALGLFLVYKHIDADDYAAAHNILSIIGLSLQFLVAVELTVRLVREWGGWAAARSWIFPVIVAVSLGATVITVRMLPPLAPIPADRLQIFDAYVLILVCAWAFSRPAAKLLRQVAAGFAFYGLLNLIAICGRTTASVHREAAAYAAWAYVASAAYLVVLIYWMVCLNSERKSAAA